MPILDTVPAWQQPVLRVPLMNQAFPQMADIREFKNKICLFNADRTRCYDVVSPRYQVIEHGAAIRKVQEALQRVFGKKFDANGVTVRSFTGGARIRAEIQLPIPAIRIGRDDISDVLLAVRNSYDRSCVFRAQLGTFRLKCSNGAYTLDELSALSAKHINADFGDDDEARAAADRMLMAQVAGLVDAVPRIKKQYEEWTDTKISLLEANALIGGKFPAMYTDPILDEDRWKVERTVWQLYNDLTYAATHKTRSVQRRMDFDDKIAALFYGGDLGVLAGEDPDEEDSED